MRKIIALLAFVLIQGCASHGVDFALEDAQRIKNGMTRDEVISTMNGVKPYQVTNESYTYLYVRANGVTGSNSSRKFTVIFGADGKVTNVPANGYFGEAMKTLGDRPW